jgi:hypothetical protein
MVRLLTVATAAVAVTFRITALVLIVIEILWIEEGVV